MLNMGILIPGTFIENKNGTVYKVMYRTKTTVSIKDISTDVIETLPLSCIDPNSYNFVDVKGSYTM